MNKNRKVLSLSNKRNTQLAPAIILFFLAPIFAEYLIGILSISEIGYILFLAPMYGGGALLIREVTRRSGRGIVTMLILGVAYGLIEEGLIDQMLFNRFYLTGQNQWNSFIPILGIDGRLTVYVLAMHAIWSTCIPIIIVEALFPKQGIRPWLSKSGLGIVTSIFILGSVYLSYDTYIDKQFFASTLQLLGTTIAVMLLVIVSFRFGSHTSASTTTAAPKPWFVSIFSLVASSIFMLADSSYGWDGFTVCVLTVVVFFIIVYRWSRRIGWGDMHRIAIAGGGILTYAWLGLFSGSFFFSCGTIILLVVAVRKLRKPRLN